MEKIIFPNDYIEETYFGIESDELIFWDCLECKNKNPFPQYTLRINGRLDWQIIYIHDGYGYFQYKNELKKIGPYSLVVFKPGEPQIYAYMPADCPYADYVHFSGAAVEKLMDKFNLSNQPFYDIIPANNAMLSKAFADLQTNYAIFQNRDYMCWGSFVNILSKFSISISARETVQTTQYNKYGDLIAIVLKEMHEKYLINTSVEEYANTINLSASRFAHIFKEITGYSPISYRNMLRLESAKKMLLETPASIEEIATQCGYNNISIFSKSFKKKYNLSPSSYRNSYIKEVDL